MSFGIDIDRLRSWIGREQSSADVVSATLVTQFRATFDLPAGPAAVGDIAPRLVHFCLCQPAAATASLSTDGHPERGGFLPPVPLPRRMWARSEIEFLGELRIGDAVSRKSTIIDITAKTGRSGPPCFVTIRHEMTVAGRLLVSERQTLVYRAPADEPGSRALAESPAPRGAQVEKVSFSAPILFRYSALTFNTHRIHYDLPYATLAEGYRGLVVHGPLQATLLLQLAARHNAGRMPDWFMFTAKAPVICGEPYELHAGAIEGGELSLWTAAGGGPTAMQATAGWR